MDSNMASKMVAMFNLQYILQYLRVGLQVQ